MKIRSAMILSVLAALSILGCNNHDAELEAANARAQAAEAETARVKAEAARIKAETENASLRQQVAAKPKDNDVRSKIIGTWRFQDSEYTFTADRWSKTTGKPTDANFTSMGGTYTIQDGNFIYIEITTVENLPGVSPGDHWMLEYIEKSDIIQNDVYGVEVDYERVKP